MNSIPTKPWHGQLRLEKHITKPQGLNISLSELAYMAVCRYINTPQEAVEGFKRSIAIERKADNTHTLSVRFELAADLHARLTARRFTATFVAYALTQLIKHMDSLTAEERTTAFEALETDCYRRRKEAAAVYGGNPQEPLQPPQAPQAQPPHPMQQPAPQPYISPHPPRAPQPQIARSTPNALPQQTPPNYYSMPPQTAQKQPYQPTPIQPQHTAYEQQYPLHNTHITLRPRGSGHPTR